MGVFLVIAACFLWGLVFAIPKYLADYNPIEIALGRYFFFGLFSLLILLAKQRHLLKKEYHSHWKTAALYSLVCTFFSYTALVACIKYSSSSTAALIFGMSPVTIPLYGNWYKKEYSYKHFITPALFMALGVLCTNLNAFEVDTNSTTYLLGIACGIFGLAAWTWYAVHNFHAVRDETKITTNDWVVMMGVVTFFITLVMSALYLILTPDSTRLSISYPDFSKFMIGSITLGVVSSWFAFYLWNVGNRLIPVSLAGQLTVFEMIFGLILVYVVEARMPSFAEMSGILFMLVGVLAAFRTLRKVSIREVVR